MSLAHALHLLPDEGAGEPPVGETAPPPPEVTATGGAGESAGGQMAREAEQATGALAREAQARAESAAQIGGLEDRLNAIEALLVPVAEPAPVSPSPVAPAPFTPPRLAGPVGGVPQPIRPGEPVVREQRPQPTSPGTPAQSKQPLTRKPAH